MKSVLINIEENCERWLLLIFYVMIVATIGMEVLRRFGLSYSSIWGEEIARYAFIYLVWVGTAAAVKDRAHLRIDVLMQFLSPKGKAFAYIFGDVIMLGIAVLALYFSYETLQVSLKFGSVTHGLRISQAWFLAAVPFGFVLVCTRLIQSICRDVSDLRSGRPVFEGYRLFD
ncbi:MAG: TRAP-type C4-dicarboxylate transport system permease small subunit [Cellvibrionaceae bacterium]|jgi:TRAP-type C4-dicarboxylate transport system permease small subunit